MIEFTVEYAALTWQWAFNETFVSLPKPGDKNFSDLYKSLKPFGITLSAISVEPRVQSLADQRLVIQLLNGRLKLRLAYGGFDFLLTGLEEGEEATLTGFFQALGPVLQQMGADLERGQVRFVYEAFIRLNEMDVEEFLGQHLTGYKDTNQLVPDSFTYKIALRDGPGSPQIRIAISRSIAPNFPSSLFVNMSFDYTVPGEIGQFSKQATDDWYQAIASLNLKLRNIEGNENASN
jgi:hypothetical protein